MQIKEYMEQSSRTCVNLYPEILNNMHMILGMITEIGELADVFKKNMAYNKPIDWINVQEEVGDCMWYLVNFCRMNNFDLEEILQNNVDKLYARYPEKFTEELATERDLDKERVVLEQLKNSKKITS